ncbi:DUF4083 family protein [Pseudogracilibacillus sp. SO30301A]|uniref:DUF4083 family protein n=1 Tax=Pseudogracilibacillus sp. SO30301A TaxID=3098291 RepID=UPI003FA7C20B
MINTIISIFFTILIIALILMFFISLYSFVKRTLTNASAQNNSTNEINKKLDRIIELLEEKNK